MLRIPIRIVFYHLEERVIAHCLELDLIGDGADSAEALARLAEAIRLQAEFSVKHGNFDNLFTPADGRFFHMYAAGKAVAAAELKLQGIATLDFEPAEVREYDSGELAPA